MATGRWVVQHHHVPSADVLSYTARGEHWLYPVGAGVVFYLAFLIGGYALLSWMSAAACAGTVALLLRRGSSASAAIAILAVPLIAERTPPRADMFTVVLFAAFLSVLWENYQTGRARSLAAAAIDGAVGQRSLRLRGRAWIDRRLYRTRKHWSLSSGPSGDELPSKDCGVPGRGLRERLRRRW